MVQASDGISKSSIVQNKNAAGITGEGSDTLGKSCFDALDAFSSRVRFIVGKAEQAPEY